MFRRISRLFDLIAGTFLFCIIRPWNIGMTVCGVAKVKTPWLISIGKGTRFIASGPNDLIELDKVWIGRSVELNAADVGRIKIGKRSTIQDNCKILGRVTLENDVILAPNVFVSSGTHEAFRFPYLNIRDQDNLVGATHDPVYIEEDVWIGANVFIKAGVRIGRGAVVGANSVVLKNLEPYGVYAGVPVKKIKSRFDLQALKLVNSKNKEMWPYFYSGFNRPLMEMDNYSRILLDNSSSNFQVRISADQDINIMVESSLGFCGKFSLSRGESLVSLKLEKPIVSELVCLVEGCQIVQFTYLGKAQIRLLDFELI